MNTLIYILGFGAIAFALYYSSLAVIMLCAKMRRANKGIAIPANRPPITILKPLKGLDDQIEANLESFFHLNYPQYQILFGVNDSTDPVIPVVHALQKRYPHISSLLVISDRRIGHNPKINNLANMVVHASHEHLLISDSNVRVQPDYLNTLMLEMQTPQVGLVTSTIRGVGADGFGAMLENLHLNSFVAGSIFAVKRMFGVSISIGKSMLFARDTLNRLGGFERFAHFLAEDHLLGVAIQQLGLEVRTSAHAIDNVNEHWPLSRFANRHIRWGIMRRSFSLRDYCAELFAHPIILTALFCAIQQNTFSAVLLAVVCLHQIIVGAIAGTAMCSDLRWYNYLAIPIKELVMFGIWIVPFFKRTIEWRGNQFRVGAHTRLHAVNARQASFGRKLWAWLSENGNRNVGDVFRSLSRGTRKRLATRFGR